jgi:PadR family transcriptional regulator PadR
MSIQYGEPYNSALMLDDPELATGGPETAPPAEAQARKFQRELSAGLTALVLLSVLADAEGDLYGYEIARRLSTDSLPAAPFKQGALYPVLRNMSSAGLLASRVVPSYAGPPRRYYRITPLGRDVLGAWRDTWLATRAFVDRIVPPSPAQESP